MRSSLAAKVFLLTFAMVAACCSVTYLCIAHFAPYIYTHDAAEAKELALPRLDAYTGGRIDEYREANRVAKYGVHIAGRADSCVVLLTQNTGKASQVALALQRAWPVLATVMVSVSLIVAVFYARYMTRPIQEISRLSGQMAALDFSGLCPVNRTDEIGMLARSLNDLSRGLASALSELRAAPGWACTSSKRSSICTARRLRSRTPRRA